MHCRVLPHLVLDGPGNMALDEALLESVAADPSEAAFRTYEWSEPTLSLGYFQRNADAEADPRWRAAPRVRRPTGGGAIWHHREVTYALIIPRSHPLSRRAGDLYLAVHSAIAQALKSQRIDARRRAESPFDPPESRPFLCFLDRDPEDLVVGGIKVVGSAQRRRSGAVLQHGSLLLAASPIAPELPGVLDLAPGPRTDPIDWPRLLREGIPVALDLVPGDRMLADSERESAADLERRVFRDRSWMERR
jgi:lipoyl(octanoyl) transferase